MHTLVCFGFVCRAFWLHVLVLLAVRGEMGVGSPGAEAKGAGAGAPRAGVPRPGAVRGAHPDADPRVHCPLHPPPETPGGVGTLKNLCDVRFGAFQFLIFHLFVGCSAFVSLIFFFFSFASLGIFLTLRRF